jgi:hypothetical protein
MAQNLSPAARRAKASRDLAMANTPRRKEMRAENQRLRRAAKKAGKNVDGKDWDHKDQRWETPERNRGNDGEGTKKEGQ